MSGWGTRQVIPSLNLRIRTPQDSHQVDGDEVEEKLVMGKALKKPKILKLSSLLP